VEAALVLFIERVESVLNHVLGADSIHGLGNLCPFEAQLADESEQEDVLVKSPLLVVHNRVEMIKPFFPALVRRSENLFTRTFVKGERNITPFSSKTLFSTWGITYLIISRRRSISYCVHCSFLRSLLRSPKSWYSRKEGVLWSKTTERNCRSRGVFMRVDVQIGRFLCYWLLRNILKSMRIV
jgi:hypothetical protein